VSTNALLNSAFIFVKAAALLDKDDIVSGMAVTEGNVGDRSE